LKKGDLGGFKNLRVERIYGKRYNLLSLMMAATFWRTAFRR
jgi:hypothetical protein